MGLETRLEGWMEVSQDLHALGKALFPKPDDIVVKGLGGVVPATTVEAYATTDSDSGSVSVDFGGETYGDEGQSVSIPTSSAVSAGQRVLVTVQNGVPVDCAVIGEGDSIRDGVVAHFWHDDEGAHITETEHDATVGGNILIDTDSVDLRDGSTVLARFGALPNGGELLFNGNYRNGGIHATEDSVSWILTINSGDRTGDKTSALTLSANGVNGSTQLVLTDQSAYVTHVGDSNSSRLLCAAVNHGNISSQGGSAQAQFATNGFMAMLMVGNDTTPTGAYGSKTLCTIPKEYRPTITTYYPVAKDGAAQSMSYVVVNGSTGVVTLQNAGGTQSSVNYWATCTWCY